MDEVPEAAHFLPGGDDSPRVQYGVLEMSTKWSYFLAAAVLGGFILLINGAPPLAVVLGLGGAALITWRRPRVN
jgi:hypothetical protein